MRAWTDGLGVVVVSVAAVGLLLAACTADPMNSAPPPGASGAHPSGADRSPGPAASDEESCESCHRKRQPGVLAQWDASVHAREDVECEDCHGGDHEAIFREKGRVPADRCAICHAVETKEFMASKHQRALGDALGNARLLAQIPAMQRAGCLGCHDMGGPRDSARCNSCHGAHRFSAEDARRPEACGTCHRGPDHPHIEAWEASRHGVTWNATEDENQAPTCATCHMPKGTHGVSGGITLGHAGSGAVLEGEASPIPMHRISREEAKRRRDHMVAICANCHTPRFSLASLEDADAIKREADRLVDSAAKIVEGLHADELLDPSPTKRLPHPTAGHALVLGGAMLYENQSEAERIFFDLAKFAHAITFKGAYHQSPDHTHWLGMARLKASVEELRAEARRLRRQRPETK